VSYQWKILTQLPMEGCNDEIVPTLNNLQGGHPADLRADHKRFATPPNGWISE
jgi:hypothetical protein